MKKLLYNYWMKLGTKMLIWGWIDPSKIPDGYLEYLCNPYPRWKWFLWLTWPRQKSMKEIKNNF